MRGDDLSEVWWRGKQWAVTSYGVEALDGCYVVKVASLLNCLDRSPKEHGGSFPVHVSEKNWVDAAEFFTAWVIALAFHGLNQHVTPADLEEIANRVMSNQDDISEAEDFAISYYP